MNCSTAAMFIERPQPKATTAETVAADLEHSPSDVRIDINDRVLAYVELFQGRPARFPPGRARSRASATCR
jgi:hypothetical protein